MLPHLLKNMDVSDPISRKSDSLQRFLQRDSKHNTMHTFLFTVSRENFQNHCIFFKFTYDYGYVTLNIRDA